MNSYVVRLNSYRGKLVLSADDGLGSVRIKEITDQEMLEWAFNYVKQHLADPKMIPHCDSELWDFGEV